jgi:outer membrane protein OmpA-like peptidoglycan-associated protein
MKHLLPTKHVRACLSILSLAALTATVAAAKVEPTVRTFTAGQKTTVQGVIVSRTGNMLKLRGEDDAIGTIDLTDTTKIQLKHGWFSQKKAMDAASLVPGLHVEAQGKGNEKGELVADKVIFDPNSMRASRQIDTRVSPLEARTGTLEGRAGQLETRAGQMETRQGQLEGQEKQTEQHVGEVQQQVGQVKTEADQANEGVTTVNKRVSDLDNYEPKYSATVYFKLNSAALSPEAKKDLDDLAQKALNEKGYVLEVAGYADRTGNLAHNQTLSEQRADAVIRYLEQEGNIPIHRILAPAGMGITHEAADNNTKEGRKLNRRVEVKVLVNQGVVAGSNSNGNSASKQPGQPPN